MNGTPNWYCSNSHDTGCAYQLHAGIYRRICANGLVLSSSAFEAVRFRHTGLVAEEVVQAKCNGLQATEASCLHMSSVADLQIRTEA
ncbi:MAG: DUF932 domain-containing protein [Verrucomicrobia bacterium]|nr:DUF932 domain-containing protein [Verrucomicrobiota bacterium]OQC62387.1 MAG: hypothetical protein BWX48_03715 [Verrucomicrobia bacterium ADurb.Bin006]NMD19721.1 DUF945 domain-containing protein [Verrucomicrobiota bacterium]HNU99899.1 DUF932 domain-containing protein [Verrucomicrobiota bacterium]HOR73102.1 DUF932 domain-containing protein [Verrucomicrobiota bacterium]